MAVVVVQRFSIPQLGIVLGQTYDGIGNGGIFFGYILGLGIISFTLLPESHVVNPSGVGPLCPIIPLYGCVHVQEKQRAAWPHLGTCLYPLCGLCGHCCQ